MGGVAPPEGGWASPPGSCTLPKGPPRGAAGLRGGAGVVGRVLHPRSRGARDGGAGTPKCRGEPQKVGTQGRRRAGRRGPPGYGGGRRKRVPGVPEAGEQGEGGAGGRGRGAIASPGGGGGSEAGAEAPRPGHGGGSPPPAPFPSPPPLSLCRFPAPAPRRYLQEKASGGRSPMAERDGAPGPGRTGERGRRGGPGRAGPGLGWTGLGWAGRGARLGTARRFRQETGAGGSAFPPCGAAAARGADPGPGRYVNGAAEGGGCAGAEREPEPEPEREPRAEPEPEPGPRRPAPVVPRVRPAPEPFILSPPRPRSGRDKQEAEPCSLTAPARVGSGFFLGGGGAKRVLGGGLRGGVWGLGVVQGNGARFTRAGHEGLRGAAVCERPSKSAVLIISLCF